LAAVAALSPLLTPFGPVEGRVDQISTTLIGKDKQVS
jgi:hypothetical protein